MIRYAEVKRELWGIVSAITSGRGYLIEAELVINTDCLPILGMIFGCNTPNVSIVRYIAYIKAVSRESRHVARKHNLVLDMLSRARYKGDEG
jgi:hypothetical protein